MIGAIAKGLGAFARIGAFCFLMIAPAQAALTDEPRLPAGYTCDQVRTNVALYGKFASFLWAKANGFSAADIAQARRCLKPK